MSEATFASGAAQSRTGLAARLVQRALRKHLRSWQAGTWLLVLPNGVKFHHRGSRPGPDAVLVVRRWRALWRIARDGDLGLGVAYMNGECVSPDIKTMLAYGAANEAAVVQSTSSPILTQVLDRIRHRRRTNTRRGSRRNIVAHYDLGNAFYVQWLDRAMNYSSALYTHPDQNLEDAQRAKLDRVVDLLEVEPGQNVLEIGCGWGALAERLARHHGCRVTGLTLSDQQLAYAQARLGGAVERDLRLQDYRDVDGRYDRIASIEMLEAVGERYWPVYFDKLRQSLTDDGVAVLQVITIEHKRFDDYRRRPDFIQRFIFPGGMLPTCEIIAREAARAGLRLVRWENFGASYARTLAEWRRRFLQAWPHIEPLGFDARFKRMWEYYLAYCEVGFELGAIDVGLVKLVPA